jgi:hypothetical protein
MVVLMAPLQIRSELRAWLQRQKESAELSEDVAGLIWLLAIEVDDATLTRLALPVIAKGDEW